MQRVARLKTGPVTHQYRFFMFHKGWVLSLPYLQEFKEKSNFAIILKTVRVIKIQNVLHFRMALTVTNDWRITQKSVLSFFPPKSCERYQKHMQNQKMRKILLPLESPLFTF